MAKVSGNSLHATPSRDRRQGLDLETRLRLFRQATDRQRRRRPETTVTQADGDRGWLRDDLYERGRTR